MSYHLPAHLQPLHERLQLIQSALANGRDLRPYAARVDGPFLVIRDKRGPLFMRLSALDATATAAAARAKGSRPADHLPAPLPVRSIPVAVPVHRTPAQVAYVRKMRERGRAYIRRDHAPRRAVGNFTSDEATARTLADLQHNVREAMASGNTALLAVMMDALQVARKRAGVLPSTPAEQCTIA